MQYIQNPHAIYNNHAEFKDFRALDWSVEVSNIVPSWFLHT